MGVVNTLILLAAVPVGSLKYGRVQLIGLLFAALMARSTGNRSAKIQSRHADSRSPGNWTQAKSRHFAGPVSPASEQMPWMKTCSPGFYR